MPIQLVWFKRDLRIADHIPLARAAERGDCLCLYVYEPELINAPDHDAAHLQFVNESLQELGDNLRRRGGQLVITTGTMPDILAALHQDVGIDKIWAHEETFNHISYQRDRRVRAWARQAGIEFEEIPQYGVVRRLKSRDGWARQWQRRMSRPLTDAPQKIAAFDISKLSAFQPGPIRTSESFGLQSFDRRQMQAGGESLAQKCLASFLKERGENYRADMSSPVTGEWGCSRMSAFLAYGNISIRTVVQRTQAKIDELKERRRNGTDIGKMWLKSLSSYQSRLSWHCHFMQKLEDEPAIEFENINRAYDGLRENEFNSQYFDAWCQGQTGYPMIDACMRALHQTGWINFRMRAMLCSFAAYHLWLHWREPAVYLARLFLDYEPGIHYSQFQMQSGVTGINTVRIYSPIKQVVDQDPEGHFIRQYVPELVDLPDKHLPQPHRMTGMEQTFYNCRIGVDYPAPIVDHAERYKAARDRIHAVKAQPSTRAASNLVFQKHGSRKKPVSQRANGTEK